jgi:hypothetical protein
MRVLHTSPLSASIQKLLPTNKIRMHAVGWVKLSIMSSSIEGPPPAAVDAKLLLCSSSLMTPPMLENCISEASSIGLRYPRTSLLSYLFSSSTPTCGVEVIFRFWYIDLCCGKPSFLVTLLEIARTWLRCSLVYSTLLRVSFSLSPFESALLSLRALWATNAVL